MNTIIYQIGRLDVNFFRELDFRIDDKIFKTSLSSFAIKDYYVGQNEKPSVVLIYPVSLPFNPFLLKNQTFTSSVPQKFVKNIKNAVYNPDEYLSNPYPLFESHPHSINADSIFIIHSLGTYSTLYKNVSFSCYYTDIFFEILIDMVERYVKHIESGSNEPIRFIIDISSGLNIYVTALLEAVRQFGVWLQLAGWYNRENIPEIAIAFSDPIITDINIPHSIHFDYLKTLALFLSPINNNDIEHYRLPRAIYPDAREDKRRLNEILDDFLIVFSAIKNNTPLAIYQFGYDKKEAILDALKSFLANTKKRLYENYTSSPNLKKDDYLKALLTFGFYYGISCLLESVEIYKHDSSGIDIDVLRSSFREIYNVFGLGLNNVILGNEVDKLQKALKQKTDDQCNEWGCLFSLLNSDKDKKETSPQKRNFFAHAGFEQNITQYRIEDGLLKLKYRDEYTDLIKEWLKESG